MHVFGGRALKILWKCVELVEQDFSTGFVELIVISIDATGPLCLVCIHPINLQPDLLALHD